jgi:SNF2 family DNA or RNA helicase
MQQSVLYLRPTREQSRLCNIYKRLQESDPKLKNFFRMWKDTKRVHNHPGVLAMPTTSAGSRSTSPCPDDDDADRFDSLWWEPYVKDRERLNDVENGYKMVVLLHILCHASALGDKVLVFSSCLRTLDFIESVVNRPNWSSFVDTLQDDEIGGFVKNEDYVRIDGTVGSGERGVRVTQFNDIEKARLFLISSRAGGIGINLVSVAVNASCLFRTRGALQFAHPLRLDFRLLRIVWSCLTAISTQRLQRSVFFEVISLAQPFCTTELQQGPN